MTINSTLRSKVVQMYLAGYGRNKVARLLQQEGLHISEGSVGNIIRAYRQHEPLKSNADINNANSSITCSGIGQTITPRDGNPLSHFLSESPESPTIANQMNNSCNSPQCIHQIGPANPAQEEEEMEEIDFSDTAVNPQIFSNPEISDDPLDTQFVSPFNQQISGSRRFEIPADNYNYYVTPENATIKETSEEVYQSRFTASDTENTSIDYDSEETWERGFVRFIMDDKKWRRRELQQIEWGKQELAEERRNLEQMMQTIEQRDNELKAKEDKLESIRPLIPSAQELHSAGITFDLVLPYIMLIHEKSVMQACDLKTAAYSVAQTIREYPDVEGLRSVAEIIKQQVVNLDALAGQKQAALETLMDLQLKGFSDTEILEWVGLVSTLNKGGLGNPGLSQGNGHGTSRKLDTKLLGVGN